MLDIVEFPARSRIHAWIQERKSAHGSAAPPSAARPGANGTAVRQPLPPRRAGRLVPAPRETRATAGTQAGAIPVLCTSVVLWALVRYRIPAQLSSLHGRQRTAPTLRANTCQLGAEAGPQSAGFVEEKHSASGLVRLVRRERAREQATASTSLLRQRGSVRGSLLRRRAFRAPLQRGEGPGSAVVWLGGRIG
jgi:hypothetical protein